VKRLLIDDFRLTIRRGFQRHTQSAIGHCSTSHSPQALAWGLGATLGRANRFNGSLANTAASWNETGSLDFTNADPQAEAWGE